MQIIPKVWGYEKIIVDDPNYCCKKLIYNSYSYSSNHMHKKKKETFVVLEGTGVLFLDGDVIKLEVSDKITINPEQYHKIITEKSNLVILEISTKHDDKDVYRKEKSGVYHG